MVASFFASADGLRPGAGPADPVGRAAGSRERSGAGGRPAENGEIREWALAGSLPRRENRDLGGSMSQSGRSEDATVGITAGELI